MGVEGVKAGEAAGVEAKGLNLTKREFRLNMKNLPLFLRTQRSEA